MKVGFHYTLLVLIITLPILSFAQSGIRGTISNDFTKQTVPFASVQWVKARFGVLSDSTGKFFLRISTYKSDSLVVNYVGHQPRKYAFNPLKDTGLISLFPGPLVMSGEIVLKSKFNKGLRWWKNIIANKAVNNPQQYQS